MLVRTWNWGLRAAWTAYVMMWFTMTHVPIPPDASAIASGWDKVIHFSAYLVLTLLTAAAFRWTDPLRIPAGRLAAGLLTFAAFDEILQGPVGRSPEFADWIADALGIAAGLVLAQAAVSITSRLNIRRLPASTPATEKGTAALERSGCC